MIDLTTLRTEIRRILHDDEYIVEVSSHPGDLIRIVVDDHKGLPISRCVELSRAITELHNRDVEDDYALEVSSPSLSEPWIVYEQYGKQLQAPVQVVDKAGLKWYGKLIEIGTPLEDDQPEYITLEVQRSETLSDGKKKKKCLVTETHRIDHDQLKRIAYDLDRAI